MDHAYAVFDLKSVDKEARIITGLASSAAPDRIGDIVEPAGASFKLPLPLLWQHDSRQPIGEVFAAKLTHAGIEIKARVAEYDLAGQLKDRLDLAWQSIRLGLVRGLSVGFRAIESKPIAGTFCTHFLKWEWLELSAVTIPANAEASIQTIRSIDAPHLAAGRPPAERSHPVVSSVTPAPTRVVRVAAVPVPASPVVRAMKDAPPMPTTIERLATFTADQLQHLKSIDATRWISCLAMNTSNPYAAVRQFTARWPASSHLTLIKEWVAKTSVPAAAPSNWGAGLMPAVPGELMAALIAYAAPFSVLGRAGFQPVPFRVTVPIETTDLATGSWVAPGIAKPVIKRTLTTTVLQPAKAAGTIVVTKDLLRMATPAAERLLRDQLARGLARFVDQQLCDPAIAGVVDTNPASITHGLTPIAASANPDADLKALVAAYVAGGGRLETAMFLLSSTTAVALRLADADAYRELSREGGRLAGVPAVASDAVGDRLILADAARVLLADDGEGTVEGSTQSSIEMANPTTSAGVETGSPAEASGAQLVSLWQANLVALRAERLINWQALAGAVQFIDNVNYLAA